MKNIIIRSIKVGLIAVLILLGSVVHIFSQTNEWIGGVGDWSVDGNWDLGHVPNNSEDVLIEISEEVFIPSGFTAQAGNINMQGKLTIMQNATLNIENNTTGIAAFSVGGILHNYGQLNILNSSTFGLYVSGDSTLNYGTVHISVASRGLSLGGKFINKSGGNLKIYSCSEEGIFNGDIFINEQGGIVEISNVVKEGITNWNSQEFENNGYISIDICGSHGIYNLDQITNGITGEIDITNIQLNGIENINSTFNNLGNIKIENIVTGHGINSTGKIISENLEIFQIAKNAIYTQDTFENYGVLNIGPGIGYSGIYNYVNSYFYNYEVGNIHIQETILPQIENKGNAKFDNFGSIDLKESTSGNEGLLNYGSFTNYVCAKINSDQDLVNFATFLNVGNFRQKGVIEFNANFTNSGVFNLKEPNNVTGTPVHQGYAIMPLNQPQFLEWNPVPNVFIGSGINLHVINNNLYSDKQLTVNAGMFSSSNNTWTPNGNAVGKDTFYLAMKFVTGFQCPDTFQLVLSSPVQSTCGYINFTGQVSNDWNDPNNWDRMRLPMMCDTVIIPANKTSMITNADSFNVAKVFNQGSLNIDNGELVLSGSGGDGLDNAGIINISSGNIESTGSYERSISNAGSIYVNMTGWISIENAQIGIYNTGSGTAFSLSGGNIRIENCSQWDIYNNNQATFSIANCSQLTIYGNVNIQSPFVNNGHLFQILSGTHQLSAGTFTNNGFIDDLHGNWNPIFFTNNGWINNYVYGTRSEGEAIPVFLGNGIGLNVVNNTFYESYSFTNPMGSFSALNNSFTPTGAAVGKSAFAFQVDNGNGCPIKSISFFASPVQLSCGNITFTGNVSNDWHNPNNWDRLRLPTACDTVIIPSLKTLTISSGFSAEAARIDNYGILNNQIGGNLKLGNATNKIIVNNDGTLINTGTIDISEGSVGIYNNGAFNNNFPGIVNIDSIIYDCIDSRGNTINNSVINCYDTPNTASIGIRVSGQSFSNNGVINISGGFTYSGLLVDDNSVLQNNAQGKIDIKSITGYGIYIYSPSQFSTYGQFSNFGKVTVDTTGDISLFIKNGTFSNLQGAVDLAFTAKESILLETPNSIFNNHSELSITKTNYFDGISIKNGALFNNHQCAEISLGVPIIVYNGSFSNDGLISQKMMNFHHANLSVFVNNGVIQDPFNAFNGVLLSNNNGYWVKPLTGTFTEGVTVPNVLQGSGTNITVVNNMVYTTSLATQSAGNYDPNQNTWTPNNLAVGLDQFYLVVDYNGQCTDTLSIQLSSAVQPACIGGNNFWNGGNTGDWNVDANWSLGIAPQYCHDVIIPAGVTVTLYPGNFGEANSILLEGDLVNDGQLTVAGASDKPGIDNYRGSLTNNGDLLISNVIGSNGNNHGIKSHGPDAITINSGTFTIDNVTDHGIFSENGSALTLNGTVNITNTGLDAILTGPGGNVDGAAILNLGISGWTNTDLMQIGNSIGWVQNNGYFNAASTSGIALEIEGSTGKGMSGGYDYLEVSGDLNLDGDLEIILVNGYIPPEGEVYEIMTYTGTLSGAFSQVILPSPEMDGWQIDYGTEKPNTIIVYKPMVNDLCSNYIPIDQTDVSITSYKGHTYGASNTGNPGTCDTDLNTAPGVWYKLTVSNFLDYKISLCNSDYDTKIGLFTGNCMGLTCIKGNDDDNGLNGLNLCSINTTSSIGLTAVEIENFFPGQVTSEIYIYVTGFVTSRGAFEMVIESSLPPCTPNGNMWLGGGSNAWNDASQWSLNHIPRRCENVMIPSTHTVTIPADYTAFASSIQLQGTLLNNDGFLEVSGAFQQPGIEVDGGELNNQGTIRIHHITGSNGFGLDGSSTATITNGGSIQTSSIEDKDIYIRNGCNFQNTGVIQLQN